jgi:hypothetical protein
VLFRSVFGPKKRDFTQALPKKMRRLAIRSALSAHAAEGTLTVVQGWDIGEAKTRAVAEALKALGAGKKALLATKDVDQALVRSAHNLPGVRTTPANLLNVRDLLSYESLIMTVDAVRQCEALWGLPGAQPEPQATAPAPAAPEPTALKAAPAPKPKRAPARRRAKDDAGAEEPKP